MTPSKVQLGKHGHTQLKAYMIAAWETLRNGTEDKCAGRALPKAEEKSLCEEHTCYPVGSLGLVPYFDLPTTNRSYSMRASMQL